MIEDRCHKADELLEIRRRRRKRANKQKQWQKARKKAAWILSGIIAIIAILANIHVIYPPIGNILNKYITEGIHNWREENNNSKYDITDADAEKTPLPKGNFVANPQVYENDDIPGIFSFNYEYDFNQPERLDSMLLHDIGDCVRDFLKRNRKSISYNDADNKIAIAMQLEKDLEKNQYNSQEEKESDYRDLINTRIDIHKDANMSASVLALAQSQQNFAEYLKNTYQEDYAQNNYCAELSLKSVENFILSLSYKERAKSEGDILYRMALSYGIIAGISENNIVDKNRALLMANALFKLSTEYDDTLHGNEAYYNIGSNYGMIFFHMSENPAVLGAEHKHYYAEQAYTYYKFYIDKEINTNKKRKGYKAIINICNALYILHMENDNLDEAQKYDSLMNMYTKQYDL